MTANEKPDISWKPTISAPRRGSFDDPGVANLIAVHVAWQLGADWRHGFDHDHLRIVAGPKQTLHMVEDPRQVKQPTVPTRDPRPRMTPTS